MNELAALRTPSASHPAAPLEKHSVYHKGHQETHSWALDEIKFYKMRFLQCQINPHTLFNALNTLAAINDLDQDQMSSCLQCLTEYFRGVLAFSEQGQTTLREERQLMEHYLAFESCRLEGGLVTEWVWNESLQDYFIPPLLLQPLIENAIKHGVGPLGRGRLRILAEPTDNGIRLATENEGAPYAPNTTGRRGIGMQNLLDRLDLAYGERARFKIWSDSGWTISEIRIQNPRPLRTL